MSKTWKERPDKYKDYVRYKPKDKKPVKSKGRQKKNIIKDLDAYYSDS